MPKIVIREIDNTTAGGAAYTNFAVVVPGFYSAADDEDDKTGSFAFDENGVYECISKEDFKEKVGLTSSAKHKVAGPKAPARSEGWDDCKALTEEEFTEFAATGKLHTAIKNTTGEYGEYMDEEYEYEPVTVNENTYVFKPTAESADADTYTKFMLLDTVGNDDIYEEHYGNQIAYELLGLGYTVLYKKLDTAESLSEESFWRPLKDKTLYDFRYIMSGLISGNGTVYTHMVNVAEFKPEQEVFDKIGVTTHGRGDCIALLDIDDAAYKEGNKLKNQEKAIESVLSFAKDNIPPSKYAAVFTPAVKYARGSLNEVDSFGGNQWFPASFHYLACAARSSERYSEWYANAGYTRGVSNYVIDTVTCKLGEAAVNMFQKRSADAINNVVIAINPIINLRGSYYLWGNRTAYLLEKDLKASHFLNIRQLCSSIKKKIYVTCRQATFDPNSNLLWINFCNTIKPMLEKMKADQGIADYKISKVKNSRKAFLSAVIKIVPIEAVEDFDISIHLEDSLEGVIATAEE